MSSRRSKAALDIGYRHIDTTEMYGNEKEVGQGIRDAGLDRAVRSTTRRARLNPTTWIAVNQIEAHPYFTNDEVCAYAAKHGIATEAWSRSLRERCSVTRSSSGPQAPQTGHPHRSCCGGRFNGANLSSGQNAAAAERESVSAVAMEVDGRRGVIELYIAGRLAHGCRSSHRTGLPGSCRGDRCGENRHGGRCGSEERCDVCEFGSHGCSPLTGA